MAEITLLATWPAQDNADGYRVRLLDAQGVQLDLQDVATTSATFGPLDELTAYQIELVAYHSSDESAPQLLSVTTPEGEEGASSLVVAWEDAASGDTARLLDDQGAELQDLGAVTSPITLTGLITNTDYQFELTRADATVEVIAFTTPLDIPGVVENLQHTFTTDSLTFTWDADADADDYRLTLSRDGALVEELTTADLTATFSLLEDGTQYDLAILASNAKGDGPTAHYQATTGYIVPAAPTNLRQFEERIIAVICRWDHAEPDKVLDTEVQLLYGDELVMADALDGAATERTFLVPMASTDYLLRVRAGNPAGWSAWAEATVSTEVFPLIDSRLGVLGATYQEDVLHTDTWDGASDQLKGVVEAVQAEPGVTVGGFALTTSYQPPGEAEADDEARFSAAVTLSAEERLIKKTAAPDDEARFAAAITLGVDERLVKKTTAPEDEARFVAAVTLTPAEAQKQYRHYPEDEARFAAAVTLGVTETLV